MRTAANTEAKLLMLTHAFEAWDAWRVCFHTDVRNERSRNALSRIGAQFEGVLRAHRLAIDADPARLGALFHHARGMAGSQAAPGEVACDAQRVEPGRRPAVRLRSHGTAQA